MKVNWPRLRAGRLRRIEGLEGDFRRNKRGGRRDHTEAVPEDTSPGARAEQGGAETKIGQSIAMRFRNSFNYAVQTQAAEVVVGHSALGEPLGGHAEELSEMRA